MPMSLRRHRCNGFMAQSKIPSHLDFLFGPRPELATEELQETCEKDGGMAKDVCKPIVNP